MGEEQRQALARLFAEDEAFKTALASAGSVDDAVRVAREYGVEASVGDFTPLEGAELSDEELEAASGGRTGMETFGCESIDAFCCFEL